MEEKTLRWVLITAIAPIAWGSTYFVTRYFLPADIPLWGSVLRALPAGIVLALISRRMPTGAWWWRSIVLGFLNVGGFLFLIYIVGVRLPSSLGATLMSLSAAAMMLLAWLLLRQRPRLLAVVGAVAGIVGVVIMMGPSGGGIDYLGVGASILAMLSSSLGFVLSVRWGGGVRPLELAGWQLLAGGVMLVPFAFVIEGAPPVLTGQAVWAFAYLSLIATALAYAAWFTGLAKLSPGVVGIVGLLNPVTGVLLGVLLAGEAFGLLQGVGVALVLGGVIVGALTRRHEDAPPAEVATAPVPIMKGIDRG